MMAPPLVPYHWLFDGLIPDPPTAAHLRKLLPELVAMIGMTAIREPVVWVSSPGWAAFQLIAQSHISLHGQDDRAWADVFSCKEFDAEQVGAYLRASLGGEWKRGQVRPVPMGVVE